MTKTIVSLLVLLVILAASNLGVTTYVAFRKPGVAPSSPATVEESVIPESSAKALAETFVTNYNKSELDAIYQSLDKLAQVQISKLQLSGQLEKLHGLLGEISDFAYTHAEIAGTGDGETFYNLHYKVSLSGPIAHGSLKLVVIRDGDKLGLVGFYLNGSDTTLNQ